MVKNESTPPEKKEAVDGEADVVAASAGASMCISASSGNHDFQIELIAAAFSISAGDTGASIGYLERVVAHDARFRDTLFLLGFGYQRAGLRRQAMGTYRRFLGDRHDHAQARFNLAFALMMAGDCRAAVMHFERVLSLRRDYAAVPLHLATCYRDLGDESKAVNHTDRYQRSRRN